MAQDQQERHSAPWSAYAAAGVPCESQGDRDQVQEIRELRQQVQDLTRVLEAISLTHTQPRERDVLPGWSSANGGVGKPIGGMAPDGPQTLRLASPENGILQSLPPFQGSLQII